MAQINVNKAHDFRVAKLSKERKMDTKERIRKIMEDVKMSQQDFAAKLGISPASLSSIFTGRTNPTNNHVQAIHKAFPYISVNWLLFGEGEMFTTIKDEEQAATDMSHGASGASGGAAPASSLFDDMPMPMSAPLGATENVQRPMPQAVAPRTVETVKIVDKVVRKIREIRVFFDDGTYETFVPSGK